jgi:hypothetical protein
MSTDASTHATDTGAVDQYEQLIQTLDTLENEALRKVESGRVYEPENERVRIKWIRIAKDVIAEKRKTIEARDLADLSERVDALEDGQDSGLKDHHLEQ